MEGDDEQDGDTPQPVEVATVDPTDRVARRGRVQDVAGCLRRLIAFGAKGRRHTTAFRLRRFRSAWR